MRDSPPARQHILLIDDSASVREVLRLALESEGYSVLEAADGREGVRLYREHRPAVVLLDIIMPEKDGIETVREVLATDGAAGYPLEELLLSLKNDHNVKVWSTL